MRTTPRHSAAARQTLACLAALSAFLVRTDGETIEVAPGRRQLFLDDHVIETREGVRTTLHQPRKRGAVIRPDIPSDGNRVQTYGTSPMWDPEERVYKMVYMAFPMEEITDTKEIGPALAVSRDGLHWEKPDLGQGVMVRGSTRNNRIRVDPKRSWTNEPGRGSALWNVIRDANDSNPDRRYKALMGVQGRTPAVSRDCVTWVELAAPDIPSADTSSLANDPDRHRYLAFVKSKNAFGRAAFLSVSEDFVHWTEPKLCFGTDEEDQRRAVTVIRERLLDRRLDRPLFVDPDPALGFKPPENYIPTWRAECYSFTAFPYEGVYIGLPMIYYPTGQELPHRRNTDGFDQIQLVVSRDLASWTRVGNRATFIGPSPNDRGLVGVYDRSELTAPGAPILVGDELRFYYTGFKSRIPLYSQNPDGSPRDRATLTDEERADLADGWSAICLAVLRRDGFVSLDAGSNAGVVVTRPLKLSGNSLCLNLDAGAGSIRVEILDERGEPITGFSGESAAIVKGDAVRAKAAFASARAVSELGAQTVRLRLTLQNASLYAFWTE